MIPCKHETSDVSILLTLFQFPYLDSQLLSYYPAPETEVHYIYCPSSPLATLSSLHLSVVLNSLPVWFGGSSSLRLPWLVTFIISISLVKFWALDSIRCRTSVNVIDELEKRWRMTVCAFFKLIWWTTCSRLECESVVRALWCWSDQTNKIR